MSRKKRTIWSAAAILLITFVSFLPTLEGDFVNWDDGHFVVNNTTIRHLDGGTVQDAFTTFYSGNYIPLTILSFAVDYHFHELDPRPYHAVNLLLHLANVLLVFWLIYLLSGSLTAAVVTTLLFALHPLRVESVAWITERKDVLFAFFYLGAAIAYVKGVTSRRTRYVGLSLALFVLSLFSKQMAVTFPVAMLAVDYYLRRPFKWKLLREKVPFFALSLILGLVALAGQHVDEALLSGPSYTIFHRFLLGSYSSVFYLRKFIDPRHLSCIYPFPQNVVAECAFYPVIALALAALVLLTLKKTRVVAFGGMFYLAALFPVLGFFAAGAQMVADRFTYLPSIGLSYIVAVFILWLWQAGKPYAGLRRGAAVLLTGVLTVWLSLMSWQRCWVWSSSLPLWEDAVKKSPHSFIAYSNLANVHLGMKDYTKAVDALTKAVEIDPGIADFYNSRAVAYIALEEYDKAIADLTMSMSLVPNMPTVFFNRGEAYARKGYHTQAAADFSTVLSSEPENAGALHSRGIAYAHLGRLTDAVGDFSAALEIDGTLVDTRYNKGKAHYELGQYDEALSDFDRILLEYPDHAKALYHRIYVLLKQERFADAWSGIGQVKALGYEVDEDILETIPAAIRQESQADSRL